ncbi:MAG: DUF2849 domain-containing protein [Pseudomonadota bacterium]
MAKAVLPVVFAANDLIEGDSVYLALDGWVRGVGDAAVAHTPEEKETLEARAKAGIEANLVVGVYDVKVALGENGPWPVARREQIKASHSTTIAVGPEAQLSDAA